jgi:hypothetical protein
MMKIDRIVINFFKVALSILPLALLVSYFQLWYKTMFIGLYWQSATVFLTAVVGVFVPILVLGFAFFCLYIIWKGIK